jgi:hypothetical protein
MVFRIFPFFFIDKKRGIFYVKITPMIKNDGNFIQYLKELKTLGAKAIKLELESEYLQEDLCNKISDILKENSLSLALKTGGFSSLNDIIISKNINADTIVAPMVETDYAFKKFIETIKSVYLENELINKSIFINIETEFGIKNLDNILNTRYTDMLDGVVIGRGDLTSSLNLSHSLIDSDCMFETISPVIQKCQKAEKKVILGGEITAKSVNFIKKFTPGTLFGFETRKVFFETSKVNLDYLPNIINKAINFEIYYLNMLLKFPNQNAGILKKRITALQKRL